MINVNPEALERAYELDRERERGGARGPPHGIPVVVKDMIDVAGMPTTGGFTALAESYSVRDAAAIRRLHDAGAVMLAKVNANDWFGKAPMNASTHGGQTLNPHNLDYVPGGSSCGTRTALAANYARVGLGTDASGSVQMPARRHLRAGTDPVARGGQPRRHHVHGPHRRPPRHHAALGVRLGRVAVLPCRLGSGGHDQQRSAGSGLPGNRMIAACRRQPAQLIARPYAETTLVKLAHLLD